MVSRKWNLVLNYLVTEVLDECKNWRSVLSYCTAERDEIRYSALMHLTDVSG